MNVDEATNLKTDKVLNMLDTWMYLIRDWYSHKVHQINSSRLQMFKIPPPQKKLFRRRIFSCFKPCDCHEFAQMWQIKFELAHSTVGGGVKPRSCRVTSRAADFGSCSASDGFKVKVCRWTGFPVSPRGGPAAEPGHPHQRERECEGVWLGKCFFLKFDLTFI